MSEITLTIDGKEIKAEAGMTVLEAARKAGIDIPTLCHHEKLEPYGGCRLCMVEVDQPCRLLHLSCGQGHRGAHPLRKSGQDSPRID